MSDLNMDGYPASRQQQRLYDLAGMESPGNQMLIHIRGAFDREALETNLMSFLDREENLNSVLVETPLSKYPVQEIRETPQAEVVFHQCDSEEQARERVERECLRIFHLEDTKSIRFDFFSWEENAHLLLVQCSRFFSDQHSMRTLYETIVGWVDKNETPAPAEEEPLQYIDFSEWQHELFLVQDTDGYRYWAARNTEPLTFGQETADHREDRKPDCESLELPEETSRSLRAVADSIDVSLESLLLASWWRVLKTYFPGSFPMAYLHPGRSDEATAPIIGLFEKCLSLPADLFGEDIPTAALARSVQVKMTEQEPHLDYFHQENGREGGKNVLFPFQFAYYRHPVDSGRVGCEFIEVHPEAFQLKLVITDEGAEGSLSGKIYHRSGALPADWATALREALMRQLELTIVREQEGEAAFLARKSDLGRSFQQQMNPARKASAATGNILDWLEQAANDDPDRAAVTFGETVLTYGAFHRQANRLAHLIRARTGSASGKIVAVQFRDPVRTVLSFVAALKAGHAFLPIEAGQPRPRAAYMVEQSEAVLFLSEAEWAPKTFPDLHLGWEEIETALSDQPSGPPDCRPAPDAPCYLIYTSGTTGHPKGVLISHASLANYLSWFVDRYEIGAEDRTVLFSSMSFDLGHTLLWSALTTGAGLHLVDPEESLAFLEHFNAYVSRHGITYIKCTPSHFKLILEDPELEELAGSQKLRLILLGGERIDAGDVERYFSNRPQVRIVNEYGPTETTIGVVAEEIDAAGVAAFRQLPVIGRPFGGHRVFILDKERRPVLPGEYGVLYVGGPGLSPGYYNRPELTKAAFMTLALDEAGEERFYATGDLGRWLPGGVIQLAGREDHQVKVRGYRIEPEEISRVAAQLEGVRSAYTLVGPLSNGEVGIRTFAACSGSPVSERALLTFLEERLPDYMLPAQVFCVDDVPLNRNGKVDRQALTELAEARLREEALVLPETEDEKLIAGIWAELFEAPVVGVQQNFFQLGGHSLLAMKMLSRLHKRTDVRVPIVDFFKDPTIAALVQYVRVAHKEKVKAIRQVAHQSESDGYFDLSLAQQRIWMQAQLQEDKGAFNVYFAAWVKGALDKAELEQCLRALVGRHENLRTRFTEVAGEVRQHIISPEETGFEIDDSDETVYAPEALRAVVFEKCKAGFDLEKDLPLRCYWLHTTAGHPLVVFVFHHIVMDEWSMDIFGKELTVLLTEGIEAGTEKLPSLPIQYKDFAAWEQMQLRADRLRQMQTYFTRQLERPLPELQLPTDFSRPEKKSFAGDSLAFDLAEGQYDQLISLCRDQESTLFSLLFALSNVLLFRLTNQTDIVVGTLEANRSHPDLENVIGCFFNVLPIRSRFDRDERFSDFLKQTDHRIQSVLANASYPFDFLLRDLGIQARPGRSPLFDVLFTLRTVGEAYGEEEKVGDLTIEPFLLPSLSSKYDLLFDFIREAHHLKWMVEYNTDLFTPDTIREFSGIFQLILTAVLEDPDVRLNEIGSAPSASAPPKDTIDTFFNF